MKTSTTFMEASTTSVEVSITPMEGSMSNVFSHEGSRTPWNMEVWKLPPSASTEAAYNVHDPM